MRHRSLAVFVVLLLAAGCGSAADVTSEPAPTTIPLFDSTDTSVGTAPGTTAAPSTAPPSTAPTDETAPPSGAQTTVSTTPDSTPTTLATTSTTIDPNAEYCAAYNALVAMDTTIVPGDTDATAAVFAARDAAWIETAALAPTAIEEEAEIVRDFTSALRQLLADNGNDLSAVLPDVVQLEVDLGADVAQIRVEQFGLLSCGTAASVPEEETAVFYASLLDTEDRRSVLADLLSTAGVLSVDEANCLVAGATVEMMFPLTGASSTPDQEAALGQLLGVCQLSAGGS